MVDVEAEAPVDIIVDTLSGSRGLDTWRNTEPCRGRGTGGHLGSHSRIGGTQALDETLVDVEAKELVVTLADNLTEAELETPGETQGEVEEKALVDTEKEAKSKAL